MQVADPQKWDLVGALMEGKSVGSAQSPSQIERRFILPMRVLALSFPPDAGGEEMQVNGTRSWERLGMGGWALEILGLG